MNSWLFEKLHISWLVAVWCLGLTIGVISIHYIPRSFAANPLFLLVGLVIFEVAKDSKIKIHYQPSFWSNKKITIEP